MKFEIIYEPSEPLYEALDRFKIELKVPYRIEDMATEIKRTAAGVTSLWDNDRWANDDLVRSFIVETKNALRDHVHVKSRRAARQLAKSIWSARRNRRGRDHKINPDLLLAVLKVVERIADRKLAYSRKRTRRAPLGVPTSGPAEGAMLDVLLAALNWAYALPTPKQKSAPLNREGVLSARTSFIFASNKLPST